MLPSAKEVAELQPQFDEIQKLPSRGLIITGLAPPGSGFDFYSRFFCPKLGIKEVCVGILLALIVLYFESSFYILQLLEKSFIAGIY